jgi:hypothetical protein
MTPAARVHLDRRIAEERMLELDRHGEQPTEIVDDVGRACTAFAITMDAAGVVSRRVPLDEVQWHTAAAFRLETVLGVPIDPDELDDLVEDEDFVDGEGNA